MHEQTCLCDVSGIALHDRSEGQDQGQPAPARCSTTRETTWLRRTHPVTHRSATKGSFRPRRCSTCLPSATIWRGKTTCRSTTFWWSIRRRKGSKVRIIDIRIRLKPSLRLPISRCYVIQVLSSHLSILYRLDCEAREFVLLATPGPDCVLVIAQSHWIRTLCP